MLCCKTRRTVIYTLAKSINRAFLTTRTQCKLHPFFQCFTNASLDLDAAIPMSRAETSLLTPCFWRSTNGSKSGWLPCSTDLQHLESEKRVPHSIHGLAAVSYHNPHSNGHVWVVYPVFTHISGIQIDDCPTAVQIGKAQRWFRSFLRCGCGCRGATGPFSQETPVVRGKAA